MERVWGITLLVGAGIGLFMGPEHVLAQACKDELSMVDGSKQALAEFTEKVKNESSANFETFNHQKSAVNKLSLHSSMLGELVACLDKAAQDPTLSKEDAGAAKTQHDVLLKLQEKIKAQQGPIKDAKDAKEAKALVEKLDLAP
jgi:hypothetical protein